MKKIKLEDIDKKTPFSVPDGFFAELTNDIQARVAEKPKKQWVPAPQLKWVLAGSFALVIGLAVIFRPSTAQLSVDDMLAQVSEKDLIDYLDISGFTESELLQGLSDEEIDQLWSEEENLENLDLEGEDLDELLMDLETDFDKYL